MTRPDYVKCIRQTREGRKHMSWCGQNIASFAFVNIDHAAHNAENQGRLLICPSCAEAISTLLHNWTP